jgi:hypothetical protein
VRGAWGRSRVIAAAMVVCVVDMTWMMQRSETLSSCMVWECLLS